MQQDVNSWLNVMTACLSRASPALEGPQTHSWGQCIAAQKIGGRPGTSLARTFQPSVVGDSQAPAWRGDGHRDLVSRLA